MDFLQDVTRNLFFTGKGGVGKTTTASATAVALADAGKRVLLVSTDPASNLDEVLGVPLGSFPKEVPGVPGLFALNVDPEAAAAAYRESIVAPYRGVLPEAAVASIEEQLSGACTVEIAAFDEFAALIGRPEATDGFDHVIFDTAPTGHTLRLLALPAAWSDFLDSSPGGASCLGPLAGLQAKHELYETTRRALADPARTVIVVVSRPDIGALEEASRASGELKELGVANQRLILNGIYGADADADPLAAAFAQRCRSALDQMPSALRDLPLAQIPLRGASLVGISGLRTLFSGDASVEAPEESGANGAPDLPDLSALVADLSRKRRGVVMTMGKGGVGKTTLAAVIARCLARDGHPVHLTTTDPAAHVASLAGSDLPALTVTRIDPKAETAAYAAEVLATVGADLDEEGRALLQEDLRSPCTEEIAVFRAFARVVAEGEKEFVVIDTAPTGHTLLLLDATETYHREVTRSLSEIPEAVRRLLPRLRDPDYTSILLLTLPEATPVHEAAALQADLRRAQIEPYAWVVNQSLSPHAPSDPVLSARKRQEARYLDEVRSLSSRAFLVPWMSDPLIFGSSCNSGEGCPDLHRR
jgi:arsenite/tail-anchored protein-transporting ATPase